jgi:formate-dependent nitrite reductase membrane component NrfD
MPEPAQHFVTSPHWEWWILGYFFFGGISGGSYVIGTLLRVFGTAADQRISRIAFIVSFLALLPCPILLILDLGLPLRFFHMLIDTSEGGFAFKLDSPMSVGSWALLVFGLFSFVSFLAALAEGGWWRTAEPVARILRGTAGTAWAVIGTVFGLFICGYTGVLLAVSNQPVWSDGWPLAGLFLASSLTSSAALLLLLAERRRDLDQGTAARLALADRNFALLEVVLLAVFLVTVALAGTLGKMLGAVYLLLWVVVIVGLAAPFTFTRFDAARRWAPVTAPILALLSVLALRAVVIFSAQT